MKELKVEVLVLELKKEHSNFNYVHVLPTLDLINPLKITRKRYLWLMRCHRAANQYEPKRY